MVHESNSLKKMGKLNIQEHLLGMLSGLGWINPLLFMEVISQSVSRKSLYNR